MMLDIVSRGYKVEIGPEYVLLTSFKTFETKGFSTIAEAYAWRKAQK